MVLTKDSKSDLIKEFGGTDANTGSSEVQVALLSARITTSLITCASTNMTTMVVRLRLAAKRHKLLKYIHSRDIEGYCTPTSSVFAKSCKLTLCCRTGLPRTGRFLCPRKKTKLPALL